MSRAEVMATGLVSARFFLRFFLRFVFASGLRHCRLGLTRRMRPVNQLGLNQDRGDRLRGRTLGHQETAVAVELDRRGLDDVRVLPQAGVALVQSDCGRVVRSHGGCRDMDRRSRREQGAVRLFLEFAVGAFDVSVGEGVIGGAIDADRPCGGDHAALGDARTSGQHQDPVGGSVKRFVRPGLRAFAGNLAVAVGDTSLLDDGCNPALRGGMRHRASDWC